MQLQYTIRESIWEIPVQFGRSGARRQRRVSGSGHCFDPDSDDRIEVESLRLTDNKLQTLGAARQ